MYTSENHDPVAATHRLVTAEALRPAPGPPVLPARRAPSAPATCGRTVHEELRRPTAELRRLIPEVFRGFSTMHDAALAPCALDAKLKELVALALAVSRQCDGCIAVHARECARLGATEEEIAETLGVVILMDGGPGTVYAPRALAAFREEATSAT
jgi:AhpD family alkylhydroperoxidase